MAAYVKTLKSGNDIIYPQTKTSGVFDDNNVNLQTTIQSLSSRPVASSITVSLVVANWSSSSQTVTATGVTSSCMVIVSPAPSSIDDYVAAGIKCTAQGTNSLTFTCSTTPSSAISVNVLILK